MMPGPMDLTVVVIDIAHRLLSSSLSLSLYLSRDVDKVFVYCKGYTRAAFELDDGIWGNLGNWFCMADVFPKMFRLAAFFHSHIL